MPQHLSEREAAFIRLPHRAKVNAMLGVMQSEPESRWTKLELLVTMGLSEDSRALDDAISEVTQTTRRVELGTDQRMALR